MVVAGGGGGGVSIRGRESAAPSKGLLTLAHQSLLHFEG